MKLKGGAPQRRFLSNQLAFSLEHSEIDLLVTTEKVRELQQSITLLDEQNAEVMFANKELSIQSKSLQSQVQTLMSYVTLGFHRCF